MKTDGLFDYRVIEIPAKYGKPINLIFQGDVHFNSHNFARKRWDFDREEIKQLKKQSPTYIISTGDIFESMSTSERHAFNVSGFHDSNKNRWEKEYAAEIDSYIKQADHLKGSLMAVFGGNHFFKFYDGTTSDMVLAQKLGATYIGCSGYIILCLRVDPHHSHVVKIFVHHGKGSGKKGGSGFTALEDAASYFNDADILVMGHDHKAGAMQLPSLECRQGKGDHWKIVSKERIIARAGSYLASYEPTIPSYAVDAMMRPSTLGYLHVILTPRRQQSDGKKVDDRWVQMKAVV